MSNFTTALKVQPLDDVYWKLLETFEYHIGAENSGKLVRVKAGYVTDFATVPRFFWSIIPPWGKYGKACVVHDFLLENGHEIIIRSFDGHERTKTISRKDVDKIFLEAMTVLKVNVVTRYTMYYAVRLYAHLHKALS